ncbi:hypothetical protein COCOBI_14-4760 [Coccomyxa sp. Obi]|nr:hypothetical protein COCOBI_14-4760 [Coccomyxa sp. Obi]
MLQRAQAAGLDLDNSIFDPDDYPKLPQDLKKWLSCFERAAELNDQLESMLIRREQIRRRLARSGSDKTTAILQPQRRDFEIFARKQLHHYKSEHIL